MSTTPKPSPHSWEAKARAIIDRVLVAHPDADRADLEARIRESRPESWGVAAYGHLLKEMRTVLDERFKPKSPTAQMKQESLF